MSVIIRRIENLLREAYQGDGLSDLDEELVEQFGENCKEALRKQFSRGKQPYTIRASGIGKPVCQQQYEKLEAVGEEMDPFKLVQFWLGDLFEAAVIYLLKRSGTEVSHEQAPIEIELAGHKVPGTCDVVLDGKMYDIKSCSPFSYTHKFKDFKTLKSGDTFGYISQLYLYAAALNVEPGGWIAGNKSSGDIKEVGVPHGGLEEQSKALTQAEENVNIINRTTSTADIKRQFELERELFYGKPTGRRIMSKSSPCYWCPFKETCWADKGLKKEPNPKSKAKNPEPIWGYYE